MHGTTPKQRAAHLQKILSRTYDEHGEHSNVIDVLTDLRHLCDRYGYDFAKLDRTAYQHYAGEKSHNSIDCEQPKPRRKYGEQTACTRCSQDIEWTGKATGWKDRGGNKQCAPYIHNGEIIRPKGYHTTRTVKG